MKEIRNSIQPKGITRRDIGARRDVAISLHARSVTFNSAVGIPTRRPQMPEVGSRSMHAYLVRAGLLLIRITMLAAIGE
ncbi:MAG TPA: hypothetical protein VMU69_13355 [Bradyrhizobium sp.]|nr:hypothetical protein [Bradyrhizobium sp.]